MKTIILTLVFAAIAAAQVTICQADSTGATVTKNARSKPMCFTISAEAWQAVTASRTPVVEQPGTPTTMAENATYPTNWAWLRAVIEQELQQIVARYPPPAIATLREKANKAAKDQADAVEAAKTTVSTEQ